MSDEPPCCSFCFNQDIPLFEGGFDPPSRICGFCAAQAVAHTSPQRPEPTPPPRRPSKEALFESIPSPKTLVAHLDQFVIGQDIAKRRLALAVSNHYKRLIDAWDREATDPIITDPDLHNVRIEKSNILLIGPSGSGKTHLVKSLASYLNVPLVIGDATSLTEAEYVGDDVESLLSRLIQVADGDIDVAQRRIVYIDEVDKLRAGGAGFKNMRVGVQNALLKMLEGTTCNIPTCGGTATPRSSASCSTRPTSSSFAVGFLEGRPSTTAIQAVVEGLVECRAMISRRSRPGRTTSTTRRCSRTRRPHYMASRCHIGCTLCRCTSGG